MRISDHPDKPRIHLQDYDKDRYCVLVCTLAGAVYIASSYTYKPAAYRRAHQESPARKPGTVYRTCIVRPGESLTESVNWVIRDWAPPGNRRSA